MSSIPKNKLTVLSAATHRWVMGPTAQTIADALKTGEYKRLVMLVSNPSDNDIIPSLRVMLLRVQEGVVELPKAQSLIEYKIQINILCTKLGVDFEIQNNEGAEFIEPVDTGVSTLFLLPTIETDGKEEVVRKHLEPYRDLLVNENFTFLAAHVLDEESGEDWLRNRIVEVTTPTQSRDFINTWTSNSKADHTVTLTISKDKDN